MESYVSVNLKKDEILIKLSEKVSYEKVVESLRKKLSELKDFYKESEMPIHVVGRILKNEELREVESIIKKEIKVEIFFDTSEELGLHGIKKVYDKAVDISETQFYNRSIRSGQKIEFEGSIVIVGDVNGGAEVIAVDNIVIMGALRGLAHAGAKGNTKAQISANIIDTPQLRIANIVKEIDRTKENIKKMASAKIKNEEIIIV